jgi:MFS family permease
VHVSGRFSLRAAVTLAPLAIPAAFVGGVAEFTYISLLPVYATQAGAAADDGLLLLSTLMAGGIVLQFAVGWLADRVDRARLLAALGVALAATTVLLGVLVHRGGLATVAAFVLGGVVLGFYAVGLALLGEQTPPGHLALANAAFLMAYELGAVAGPLAGGAAMDLVRPHGLAAVVATAGLAFALHAWRHRSRRFRPR